MSSTQIPLFSSESSWKLPDQLPDFRGSKIIGFDVETCDPDLEKMGPGFIRKNGRSFIAGISFANERGQKIYIPIAHQNYKPGGVKPVDRAKAIRYAKKILEDPSSIKVAANILYDLEALYYDWGITVQGKQLDILVAEPLIDENQRTYNLDRLSKLYLGSGKNEELLNQELQNWFGKKANKGDLWKLPPEYVGPYAETDAENPVKIIQLQLKKLEEEGLTGIFDLETRVTQVLLYMRKVGVPVDLKKAERVMADLQRRERETQAKLEHLVGIKGINVWSGLDLAKAFDKLGLFYLKTPAGNPSFEKKWLESNEAPVAKLVNEVRALNRMWSVFIQGTVIGHSINGRVHCQFHQMRGDDGGTVTGRFSSSNPNLQQVPARNGELAPLVRGLFIPEEDHEWNCDDYSQVEPRIQVHYAVLRNMPGAAKAAQLYIDDPKTDFHQMTAELTGLERKKAKNIHLGISYGMGVAALAGHLGVSEEEAKKLREQYNEYMPFLDGISREVNNRAADVGFIKTLLGRKRRFEMWEPAGYDRRGKPLPTKEEAVEAYGLPVRRADTRKAFNGLIQGSAADVIKKAMVDVFESGVLDDHAIMHLTVHDELDLSVKKGCTDVADEIVRIMSTCVPCRVPLKVDSERGPSWGEVK